MDLKIAILFLIALAGIWLWNMTQNAPSTRVTGAGIEPTTTPAIDPQRQAVKNEYFRLALLSEMRNITTADLANMGNLTAFDSDLHGEWNEAIWMAQRNLTHHLAHSLEAIYIITTKGKYTCPSDSLSHVGLFLESNETKMAQDAFQDGKDTLAQWESNALTIKTNHPDAYPGLDALLLAMHGEISDFDSGNYSGVKEKSDYLENNGYC